MRVISTLVLAAAAAAATTDDVGSIVAQIPTCAFPCFTEASKTSGCSLTDYTCMCNNISQVQNAAVNCLTTSCQPEDLSKLATVSTQLCKAIAGTSGTAKAGGAAATGSTTGSASGAAATGTAPTPAGAGRSVAAVGVAGLAVVAAAALLA